MTNLDTATWWSQYLGDENAVLVDVRTEEEFVGGKIPGAINLDIHKGQAFVYLIEELDKQKNYYVYCAAGIRSSNACHIMEQLGISNTFNLMGGISRWTEELE